MTVAIIIFLVLSIVGTGTLTINEHEIKINWFALVALILFLIKAF